MGTTRTQYACAAHWTSPTVTNVILSSSTSSQMLCLSYMETESRGWLSSHSCQHTGSHTLLLSLLHLSLLLLLLGNPPHPQHPLLSSSSHNPSTLLVIESFVCCDQTNWL